jgi:hypothetical protein
MTGLEASFVLAVIGLCAMPPGVALVVDARTKTCAGFRWGSALTVGGALCILPLFLRLVTLAVLS